MCMSNPIAMTDSTHRDRLAHMLARVFDRDPHFNWLVRQDRRREEALLRLFQLLLGGMAKAGGEVHVDPDGKAVAIGYPPGAGQLPLWRQLALLGAYLPICGWRALPTRALGLQISEAHRPRRPHYFLQVVGVDETVRRQGRGRALMAPLLHRCEAQRLPVYLETGNPGNLGFYQALGFSVVGSYVLPGRLKLWGLLREAKTGRGARPVEGGD
jgi:GNAT superfamily N-acetyltransferase